MDKNTYHVSLELTSHTIKLIVGFVLNEKIYILDVVQQNCSGLKDGLISDVDECVKCIKNVVVKANLDLNIAIKDVSIILPPFNLACTTDSGSTNTIDGSDIVRHVDTTNIITQLKKRNFREEDLKIIDVIPDAYFLSNNERYNHEPIGKTSDVLSLHASIYAMSNKVVNMFVSCIKKAGLNVKYQTISPYASSLYLSTLDGIPSSYILIDIGHSITTISQVHQQTTIIKSSMIKFGGDDITKFISDEFKISYDMAEEMKIKYGIDHDPNFPVYISKGISFDALADTITNCVKPVINEIQTIIKELSLEENNNLPIVLIGGTSMLNHIEHLVADELDLSVITYQIPTIGARDRGLTAALGLIKYSADQPRIDDEEKITASITRIDNRKIGKFDITEDL